MAGCFGSKKEKKPTDEGQGNSNVKNSDVKNSNVRTSKNIRRSNINDDGNVKRSRGGSRIKNSGVKGSNVKGSRHEGSQYRDLQKSSIRVEPIHDRNDKSINIFENAKTQKIVLTKTTHEHAAYVREADYLTRNDGNYSVDRVADTDKASYQTGDPSDLKTPVINKFFYDNDAYKITRNIEKY